MRIASKVPLGFAVFITLLLAILGYEYSTILELQQTNDRLSRTYFQAGQASTQLLNDAYEIDDLTRKYLLTADADYATFLKERSTSFRSSLNASLGLDLEASQETEFAELKRVWEGFSDNLESLLDPDPSGVDDRLRRSTLEHLQQLVEQATRLGPATRQVVREQLQASSRSIERVRTLVWMGGSVAVLAAIVFGFLLVRSITRPIQRLTVATRELAKGDFQSKVDDSGKDETGELARHFNLMVQRLSEYDELKNDFVSHVSHELKAPMASMQETTALLMEEIPGALTESQRRLLRLNQESGARLSSMIHELLRMSKLEAGVDPYSYKRGDFVEIVAGVTAEMDSAAGEKEIEIRVRSAQDAMIAECDPGKIVHVIRNLLENAVKFSPAGAGIDVHLDWCSEIPEALPPSQRRQVSCPAGQFLLCSVQDRGPGVPDAEKQKIFFKFHQVGRTKGRTSRGVGLGLAIAYRIVMAHRGGIWVEDGPSEGSIFRFLICRGRARGFSPPLASLSRPGGL